MDNRKNEIRAFLLTLLVVLITVLLLLFTGMHYEYPPRDMDLVQLKQDSIMFGGEFVELGNLPAGPFEPFEGCPRMEIVPLPGHSYDMVGVLVNDEKIILTSDLIFRYWPVIIPLNDGDLRDYLDSLSVLQRLVRSGKAEQFIPAHGFPIDQPIKALEGNRAHHRKRIEIVRPSQRDRVLGELTTA